MTVFEFTEHIPEHLKQAFVVHPIIDSYFIFGIDTVPIQSVCLLLVREETVMLVNDFPKRLEIALRVICVLVFVYTGREGQQT
jgi:hypothetical protein